jgi:ATP-dependent 26S proteasome regulatory subunit
MELREKNTEYDKTEDDLKALQSVGQIIGELLRQLDDERYIVKASSGPRYVVGCRNKVAPSQNWTTMVPVLAPRNLSLDPLHVHVPILVFFGAGEPF